MKRISLFFSAFIITLFFTTSAMAIGIGAYVDLGAGSTTWGSNAQGSSTDLIPTGGLIIDSAAAKNKIFNYRFKFGGGKMFSGDIKMDKIGMVHTFGLSPVNFRGDQARFFFGPRIGMYYIGGEVTTTQSFNPWMLYSSGSEKTRLDLFRFDLGMVLLGFNFNLGEFATITFEFGANYGIMLGEKKGTITAPGYEVFSTMGFMYRINDTYGEPSKSGENRIQVQELK